MSDEQLSEFVVDDGDQTGEVVADENEQQPPQQTGGKAEGGAVKEDTRAVEQAAEEEPAPPAGETDAERTARQARNRETRDRKKQARERDRRLIASQNEQIAKLTERLARVEGRTDTFAASQVDARLTEWENEFNNAQAAAEAALAAGDGKANTAAVARMLKANTAVESLKAYKQQVAQAQTTKPEPVTEVDPLVAHNTAQWRARHSWFDSQLKDRDSLIARAIDASVWNAGFDPRTQEYWDELDEQLAQQLPHRYRHLQTNGGGEQQQPQQRQQSQQQQRQPPRQIVGGSGREGAPGANGGGFIVSRDRKEALMEAGMWDRFQTDKAFRQDMIHRFKEADAAESSRR